MESPINFNYTLGVFFDIWGKQFDQMLRQHNCCNMSTPVRVYVNGIKMPPDNTRNIPLKSRNEIAIVYGTPPDVIPTAYQWPSSM